jgi:hypothetical protein
LPLVAAARQPVLEKLGSEARKDYIELMHCARRTPITSPLHRAILVAATLAWWPAAHAQSFAADYSIRPAFVEQDTFSGAGLSFNSSNWYAQFAVGHGLKYSALPGVSPQVEAVSLGGGYRWADGQALSLQVTGRTTDRLGLAVSYDWPRYFVRLQYDPKFTLTPAQQLRFSAGMRF